MHLDAGNLHVEQNAADARDDTFSNGKRSAEESSTVNKRSKVEESKTEE